MPTTIDPSLLYDVHQTGFKDPSQWGKSGAQNFFSGQIGYDSGGNYYGLDPSTGQFTQLVRTPNDAYYFANDPNLPTGSMPWTHSDPGGLYKALSIGVPIGLGAIAGGAAGLYGAGGAGGAGAGAGAGASASPQGLNAALINSGGVGLNPAVGGGVGLNPVTGATAFNSALSPALTGGSLGSVLPSAGSSTTGSSAAPVQAGGAGSLSLPALAGIGALAAGVPAAIGAYGANQQANAYKDVANQYMQLGAPYRSRLSDLYNDPNSFLNSQEVQIPIQQATNILAHSLSTKGNPAGSGNALQQLQSYAADQLFSRLGQEKDRLAGFGGLSAYNAAAPQANMQSINAQKGVYDALGAGAADIFNPPQRITLQDLFRSLQ